MSNTVKTKKGRAKGGFREWAIKLVGGSRLWREHSLAVEVVVVPTGMSRRPASWRDTGGEKPICAMRLDLHTEPWAPPPDLVKLEPLTEP